MPLTTADDLGGPLGLSLGLPNYPWTRYSRLRAACEVLRGQNWDVTGSLALVATSADSEDSPSPPTTAPDAAQGS